MAKSGTLNSSNYEGRYIQFSWTATQSVTDNTSTISWTLKGAGTGESGYYHARNIKVTIDGSTVYYQGEGSSSNYIKLYNGTEVASGTKTLTHKSDGSRTFAVTIEAGIYVWAVNCTGEKTFTLDTIPRASTFKVSSTSADMNTAVTFTITRASTAFTHKLTYSFEGKTGTIGSDIATSKSWTIPLSLAAAIPSKTSGTATITLTTYNGSTAIGTKTLTMTLKVPSSVVPTISSVTITEATSGLADKFGAFIQNKSKLKVVIAASGVQSSTIKSYSTKILSKTYSGSTITSGLITSSGSVSVAVTVTDSRGRTATSTKNVTVLAYSDPKITSFTAQRCDSDGTLNDDGEYVQLAYAFEIVSLNSKNNNTYSIAYKLPSDSDYTSLTSGNAYSADTTYVPATLFDVDNSYEIKLTVKDYFKTVTYIVELSTAFTLVDYHSSGKGMSIGKVAELEGVFEVGLPIKLTGGMYSESKVLWSGGYYMNASQTATLSAKVSDQLFGIVLVFSRYDISNSEVLNEHFCYHFVPKEIVSLMPGKGSIFNMSTSNETYSASKYLYISDTEIKGHENNVAIGTGDTGVAYSNNRFVLRYVIGV